MTREEEIIEAGIDYTMSVRPMCLGGLAFEENIRKMNRNKSFEEGAKWADKTMIDKACNWLLKGGYFVNNTETINDFKQAMEGYMNEDFVCFEIAKKLKENEFYCEYPFAMYNKYGKFCPLYSSEKYYFGIDDFDKHACIAPTISQVLKWLRNEKKIFVVVFIDDDNEDPVTYNIFRETDCVYHHHGKYFALSEWSKCEMAGIEYVIDNLI